MVNEQVRQPERGSGSAQLARQWAILRLLHSREYSVRELAEQLGASKSSIQRDIVTLQEHFMIVALPKGQQKRVYRLARSAGPRDIRITSDELGALERARPGQGPNDEMLLERLVRKVRGLACELSPS